MIRHRHLRFEILGKITDIEIIAGKNRIRDRKRLRYTYGYGHWRKCKGVASVRLADGSIWKAELHWYEAHGIGPKEFKIKYLLENP